MSSLLDAVEHICYNIHMKKSGEFVSCGWCSAVVYKKRSQILSHHNHYCSHDCRIKALNKDKIPWNKGTIGVMKRNSGSIKKGQRLSIATEFKPRKHSFTGTDSEYKHIHYRVGVVFGKPDTCEICGMSGLTGKSIHWANATGVYDEDRSNWKRLCAKCHAIFDERIPRGKFV